MSNLSLELGEIVHVEVRDAAGTVTAYTHDYPVDASTLLRIPSLGLIPAAGMALNPELRDTISDRFVSDGVLSPVTVNATLSPNTVDFQTNIAPGDLLFVRVLGPDGAIDASSGSYLVDAYGFINIPSSAAPSCSRIGSSKPSIKSKLGWKTVATSRSPSLST